VFKRKLAMKKKALDAVAMTRRIRDAHAEQLGDATPEERIRYYREKARRLHASLGKGRRHPPDDKNS
jgi:hypothetical protein